MGQERPTSYWGISRQPLQILVFLFPYIALYEFALLVVLRGDDGVLSNLAHIQLLRFFEIFGLPQTSGLFVGGVLIMAVLFVWHLLNRDPWTIKPMALVLMTIEAVLLTMPLIVLDQLLGQWPTPVAATGGDVAATLAEADVLSRIAISVGAGLYEELVFRMMLVAMLHTLLVNALKMPEAAGTSLAVVIAAVAFTLYHPVSGVPSSVIAFYFLAGIYFGVLFVGRGFGIVVAVHAIYDMLTVMNMDG